MEIKLNCFSSSSLFTQLLDTQKGKIGQSASITPKVNMPTVQSDIAAAYSEKDFLMNQNMEKEMLEKVHAVFETNDYLSNIDKVFYFLDYNFSSIRSNIRCGMVTNWKEIMEELEIVYKKVLLKIQKKIQKKNMKYEGNGSNSDSEFMNLCFVYNHCEIGILHYVHPIIVLCDDYSSALEETLAEKNGLPEALGLEISGW